MDAAPINTDMASKGTHVNQQAP